MDPPGDRVEINSNIINEIDVVCVANYTEIPNYVWKPILLMYIKSNVLR